MLMLGTRTQNGKVVVSDGTGVERASCASKLLAMTGRHLTDLTRPYLQAGMANWPCWLPGRSAPPSLPPCNTCSKAYHTSRHPIPMPILHCCDYRDPKAAPLDRRAAVPKLLELGSSANTPVSNASIITKAGKKQEQSQSTCLESSCLPAASCILQAHHSYSPLLLIPGSNSPEQLRPMHVQQRPNLKMCIRVNGQLALRRAISCLGRLKPWQPTICSCKR